MRDIFLACFAAENWTLSQNPVSDTHLLELCKLRLSWENLPGGLLWAGKEVATIWGCQNFYPVTHCGTCWKMVLSWKKCNLALCCQNLVNSLTGNGYFSTNNVFLNRVMLYIPDELFGSLKWNPVFSNWNSEKIARHEIGSEFIFFLRNVKASQVIGARSSGLYTHHLLFFWP